LQRTQYVAWKYPPEEIHTSEELEGETVTMEQSPINMHLAALKYRCSLEINNYRQKKESDDRYCLEIFKRAIIDGDNEAWVALQEQFRENVLIWLRCHTKRQEALRIETEQNYIDDTFKRFWLWGNNQRLEFRSLAGALKSLNLCLNSLITDNLRFYARSERIPLPENRISTASTNGGPDDKRELWQAIQKILTDKRELRIVFLLYNEGLKPREIIQHCPGEFSDEKEVYHLTRNALDRLRRNASIIRWKISYEE